MGVGAILTAIEYALSLLDHLFTAFNNAPEVQAKVAQMNQDGLDLHRKLLFDAMHGTQSARANALAELRSLAAE